MANQIALSPVSSTINNEGAVMTNVRKTRKTVEPITQDQSIAFNDFLNRHNLIKGRSVKRMRIYRKIGNYTHGRYPRSRDFVYVVSADDYRNKLDTVKADLIDLSKQVMDESLMIKNAEYVQKMSERQRQLLMNGIDMMWQNAKGVTFSRIPHVITDRNILKHLDAYAQERIANNIGNGGLAKFRIGAKISELQKHYKLDWNQWSEKNVIVDEKTGEVIAAYSYKDMHKLYHESFKPGLFDKFDYNLSIIKPENLAKLLNLSEAEEKRLRDADITESLNKKIR